MKDLFIDNSCVVQNFANPADAEYKQLIQWLLRHEENSPDNAYLVVSKKLLGEYIASSGGARSAENIVNIIDFLTKKGRLNSISNKDIKEFMRKKFTKKVEKKLRSNRKDHPHIAAVLLSERKMALTEDEGLWEDLLNFPGYDVLVDNRPENLPYE